MHDKTVVIETKTTGGLSGALVGGLIFGGVGAIVGSQTASSKSTQKEVISKITLEIVLNCSELPIFRMTFGGGAEEIKKIEFYQTLLELIMLDVNIPKANNLVDIEDTVTMIKLRTLKSLQ